MKLGIALAALVLLPVVAPAQEAARKLEGPGQFNKYLTPGQLDSWILQGEKGETLIAYVTTREFDPTLELAAKGDKEDHVLFEVDDEGSESRFSVRLPESGEYRIRIHGFKYQGGGNYTLQVRRFKAKPLQVGQRVTGAFNHEGASYLYFPARKGQILIPDVKGTAPNAWKLLDYKGRDMNDWVGSVPIEEDGEYSLVVNGRPDDPYDLVVRQANHKDLHMGPKVKGQLGQAEMDVWSFEAKPGDFRVVEVEERGDLAARLVYAPAKKTTSQRLPSAEDRPELQLIPVASRAGHLRFAMLLGREGRYQLHLLAQTPASYEVWIADPTLPLERGREQNRPLPVGGSDFFSFEAQPGQLVRASLASRQFVPLLRLYDSRGSLLARSEDGAETAPSRITFMIKRQGVYRLQASSVGDGGGGDFRMSLEEQKLKDLRLGARDGGNLPPGATDFWVLEGKEGQTRILSIRSAVFDPAVSVYGPDGVQLAGDGNRPLGSSSLLSFTFPKTGRYTVWLSSRRGAGEYSVRLLDGD